jgi:hypothetical protein
MSKLIACTLLALFGYSLATVNYFPSSPSALTWVFLVASGAIGVHLVFKGTK